MIVPHFDLACTLNTGGTVYSYECNGVS